MKKLIAVLCFSFMAINVNADERYAHEYSSESDEEWHERHRDNDEYESQQYGRHSFQSQQRYQQNHQQLPIQIYMQANQNYFPSDKQSREDARWRKRRAELQQSPQTPYYENQFNRDDTHW